MQRYIKRLEEKTLRQDLKNFPVVAILGSRQCGKSTLVKEAGKTIKHFLYLDLEKPSDLRKLSDPELFFSLNADKIICLDEIQLNENLFPILRGVIDENRKNGRFIILGSASRELIEKSSETLAGRISFINLTPFTYSELAKRKDFNLNKFWLRGAYPDSYLSKNNDFSLRWRENFIKTYIERDLPQLGLKVSARLLRRLFIMSAHFHGQVINYQKISQSLSIDYHTVQKYLDVFEQSFVLRRLEPFFENTKKRLIKSPKLYIRDSGILHSLFNVENIDDLMSRPFVGASWEGMIIENIITEMKSWKSFFYRTASGNEIDLILEKGQRRIAIEIKLSTAPQIEKGFYSAIKDLKVNEAWIIAPVKEKYPISKKIFVGSLGDFLSFYK